MRTNYLKRWKLPLTVVKEPLARISASKPQRVFGFRQRMGLIFPRLSENGRIRALCFSARKYLLETVCSFFVFRSRYLTRSARPRQSKMMAKYVKLSLQACFFSMPVLDSAVGPAEGTAISF